MTVLIVNSRQSLRVCWY